MTYCTASDIRSIVHTGLSDGEIEAIIALSDAEIDKRLGSQDSSDKVIKKLSMLLTAKTVKLRQPGIVAVGEYSENNEDLFQVLDAEIEKIYRLCSSSSISSSRYGVIDEEERTGVDV